jgi:hypothetical protein
MYWLQAVLRNSKFELRNPKFSPKQIYSKSMDQPDDPLEFPDNQASEDISPSAAEHRLAEILLRVAAGDTSVVSEVYWLQNLNRKKPPER